MNEPISDALFDLLRKGHLIAAIKLVKDERGLDLMGAKTLVDQLRAKFERGEIQVDDQRDTRDVVATWTDGLAMPGGSVAKGKRIEFFVRAPVEWTETNADDRLAAHGDGLSTDAVERVLAFVYGENWRRGNEDGSAYRVFALSTRKLTADDKLAQTWMASYDPSTAMRWCCRVDGLGKFHKIEPLEFG